MHQEGIGMTINPDDENVYYRGGYEEEEE